MVSGANTAMNAPEMRRTRPICPAATVPCIRPRTAGTRCVMGLAPTIACSHDGMVCGSTKMLLANVRGNRTRKLAIITEQGSDEGGRTPDRQRPEAVEDPLGDVGVQPHTGVHRDEHHGLY